MIGNAIQCDQCGYVKFDPKPDPMIYRLPSDQNVYVGTVTTTGMPKIAQPQDPDQWITLTMDRHGKNTRHFCSKECLKAFVLGDDI